LLPSGTIRAGQGTLGTCQRMGSSCCRRSREQTSRLSDYRDWSVDEWLLIEFPEEIQRRVIQFAADRPLSAAKKRWIIALLKIRILREFRTRWSRLGSWLNLHPAASLPSAAAAERAEAARRWAGSGRAILVQYQTARLFVRIRPRRPGADFTTARARQPTPP
jgi:hypothetical protein